MHDSDACFQVTSHIRVSEAAAAATRTLSGARHATGIRLGLRACGCVTPAGLWGGDPAVRAVGGGQVGRTGAGRRPQSCGLGGQICSRFGRRVPTNSPRVDSWLESIPSSVTHTHTHTHTHTRTRTHARARTHTHIHTHTGLAPHIAGPRYGSGP